MNILAEKINSLASQVKDVKDNFASFIKDKTVDIDKRGELFRSAPEF